MKTIIACILLSAGLVGQPATFATFAALAPRAPKIQWQSVLGGEKEDWPMKITEAEDGSFYIGGGTHSPAGGNKTSPLFDSKYRSIDPDWGWPGDIWVVKLNKTGRKQWDRSFGGEGEDSFSDMALTPDGGLWVSGGGFRGGNHTSSARV